MAQDNILLDQIYTHTDFDLTTLIEQADDQMHGDEVDYSPFDGIDNNCKYYYPAEANDLLTQNNNLFSIFCLNTQGLKAHWDAFCNLISETCEKNLFDIIGITELYSMSADECQLPGYHNIEYKTRCDTLNSRGGVGIYIRNEIKYKTRPDLSIFIPNIFESLFVELKLNNKSLIIGTIYRPNTPPKADIDIFLHTMQELQHIINEEKKDNIIMGDMNIDLLQFNTHNTTTEYMDNNFAHGFFPLITKPTRVTPHSATLIDHMFINKPNIVASSGILISDLSDHFGVFSVINLLNKDKTSKPISKPYRSYSQANINIFKELLSKTDFSPILAIACPNNAYNTFMNTYKEYHDIAFPETNKTIPKKYLKRSPWISAGLIKSSITKAKLLVKKLKHPTIHNIKTYKNYYRIYNNLVRLSKKQHYHDKLLQAQHDIKQTWSVMRAALNLTKPRTPMPEYFTYNNSVLHDKKDIANKFNIFFANIGKELSENVQNPNHNYTEYMNHGHNRSIFLKPINPNDILNIVANLKSKTSRGHDGISTKLVKQTIEHILIPLTHIINKSMQEGVVPDQMKLAKIIPIFKTGDKHTFNNYRPISLLPAFSKIIEKVLSKQLIQFLESENLIYKHQYGFRPHHSTIHPIIHLLNQISEENDKPTKNLTLSVFIDLSKAFDTISHKILLYKLNNLGIRGVANNWFKSYLQERLQFMEIYDQKSTMEPASFGVPQGSILGPILFLIYVNDICNSTSLNILSFADDTTISAWGRDPTSLYTKMNTELKNLTDWFRANRLCLNVKKTKYILFNPSHSQIITGNNQIILNDSPVDRIGQNETVKSFKFLGIHIDEHLSWKYHVEKLCSKISKSNYIINKIKKILPESALATLYSTLIQSHLNYGILIWGNSNHIGKVYKMQKRSLRIINNKSFIFHTEPLFKKGKILKVSDLYHFNAILFMFQLKKNKLPPSFKTELYFKDINNAARHTRQNHLAKCHRYRTTYSSKLPRHTLPRTWNIHINFLDENKSLFIFKKETKFFFLNQYSNIIQCTNARCRQCFRQ